MSDTMKKELEAAITACAKKAKNPADAVDALQYTQAALNAANTLIGLDRLEREQPQK